MRSLCALLVITLTAVTATNAAGPPASDEVAAQVDRLLESSFRDQSVTPAPLTNDEDFLRRVYLDLAGTIPTPREVTYFGLQPGTAKRAEVIDRLLATDDFARNWAAYLREVVFFRATETRARAAQGAFENWLVEQLQQNRHWDQITTDILTATGNVEEQGAAAFIFAHTGEPAELAGEVSRVFLGIQIQCANCHDHPYDSWKRQQFHELAAFFPRIQVRQDLQTRPPVFTVASADFLERVERGRQMLNPEQMFRFQDRNRDGKLTKEEMNRGPAAERFDFLLAQFDKNKDGGLQPEELAEAELMRMDRPGQGSAEYYMPDLNDPASKGTLIEPTFFIDGTHLERGARDLDRREELAAAITARDNPWFARAFVNRIWTELLGEGFYNPVDDLGPQRQCVQPEVLDALCAGFVASDYDIRWLFRTITHTHAYQRQMGTRAAGDPSPAFAAAVPTRLRSDQVYSCVQKVLGIEGLGRGAMPMLGGAGNGAYLRGLAGSDPGRFAFFQLFNFDPSLPQADILGTVPQALFMMNSPLVQQFISANSATVLGQTLQQYADDRDALSEVYLRVLSREPAADEVALCREHITASPTRQQAYEDILWSLLNSSEFLTKR